MPSRNEVITSLQESAITKPKPAINAVATCSLKCEPRCDT